MDFLGIIKIILLKKEVSHLVWFLSWISSGFYEMIPVFIEMIAYFFVNVVNSIGQFLDVKPTFHSLTKAHWSWCILFSHKSSWMLAMGTCHSTTVLLGKLNRVNTTWGGCLIGEVRLYGLLLGIVSLWTTRLYYLIYCPKILLKVFLIFVTDL